MYSLHSCLRYCKSTSFQANHNVFIFNLVDSKVVCDTAKVRVFKQITTKSSGKITIDELFAILQKYEFSSKSQLKDKKDNYLYVVCDTAKVRVFKQITTYGRAASSQGELFAILQKYEFSSKSQHIIVLVGSEIGCLRYCKSTSFQANHNMYSKHIYYPTMNPRQHK